MRILFNFVRNNELYLRKISGSVDMRCHILECLVFSDVELCTDKVRLINDAHDMPSLG